jgi:hypothetical protein
VEIYFRVPNDERTHPLIESQWRHDPRSRSIVFVYDEGKRRVPKISSFSQRPNQKSIINNHQSSINPSSTSITAQRRVRFPENGWHHVNT